MKKSEDSEFGARLREAFGNKSNSEIANILEVSPPAVTNYMTERLPSADMLLKISGLTNCSIHWLLTGEGERERNQSVDQSIMYWFNEAERSVLQEIAEAGGVSIEETIATLVRESLAMKGIGEMPEFFPVPVFQTVNIDDSIVRHLDSLPPHEKKAETQRLIGALVMQGLAQR